MNDSAFNNAGFIYFKTKVVDLKTAVFSNNTGTIIANDAISAYGGCCQNNSGIITAENLIEASDDLSFSGNSGTLNLNKLTIAGSECFIANHGTINIKSLFPIGNNASNNSIIGAGVIASSVFNVNIANQTSNNGQPDGDLIDAIANGATVNYFVYP